MSYIELENVSFNWPRGERVLAGINLEIGKQETLALVGANGSGKTTLGRLCSAKPRAAVFCPGFGRRDRLCPQIPGLYPGAN